MPAERTAPDTMPCPAKDCGGTMRRKGDWLYCDRDPRHWSSGPPSPRPVPDVIAAMREALEYYRTGPPGHRRMGNVHSRQAGTHRRRNPPPPALLDELERLRDAIRSVVTQEADDLCWLDVYTNLAKLVGIYFTPKLMADPEKFIANCRRFNKSLREGGKYTTADGWRPLIGLRMPIPAEVRQMVKENLKEAGYGIGEGTIHWE